MTQHNNIIYFIHIYTTIMFDAKLFLPKKNSAAQVSAPNLKQIIHTGKTLLH